MEPRRKAAADRDRAKEEARAAAPPGVALADRDDSSREPCPLCRNVESRKCPRCAGNGTELTWSIPVNEDGEVHYNQHEMPPAAVPAPLRWRRRDENYSQDMWNGYITTPRPEVGHGS